MRKYYKSNKKGFTLVEMMLAIAIMMLVSAFFITMLWSIINGHSYVAYENDLADFAALNAQALETELLQATSIGTGGHHLSVDGLVLAKDDHKLFDVNEYQGRADGEVLKYTLSATFSVDADFGVVIYIFWFQGSTGMEQVYRGSVYIPTAKNVSFTEVNSVSTLYYA